MRFPWSTEFHASLPAPVRAAAVALACGAILVMAGCTSAGVKTFGVQENFGSVATYSRLFDKLDLFANGQYVDRTDDNATWLLYGRFVYRLKEWPYLGVGYLFKQKTASAIKA